MWRIEGRPGGPGAAVLSSAPPVEAKPSELESPSEEILPAEIAFLEGRHADRATLLRAVATGRRWRVSSEQVLLASGLIAQTTYYRALSAHLGLRFARLSDRTVNWQAFAHPKGAAMARANIVPLARTAPGLRVAIAPEGRALRRLISLTARPDATRLLRNHLLLATPRDIASAVKRGLDREMLEHAGGHLARSTPELSAAAGIGLRQKTVLAALVTLCLSVIAAAPALSVNAITVLLALSFAPVNILRTAAVLAASRVRHRQGGTVALPARHADDHGLPVYTLLVPLFKEAAVLPQLVKALQRIDYPAAKLDIKLIFEAEDREGLAVAQALRLPASFQRVVVPFSRPQTKPKALNFALQLARGSLVAVYDAEDRPEPNQLRRAVAAFAAGPPELACVQARLGFYNARRNWLTRQFALEYAALFEAQLPALETLRLPIPLGGTSNHFRRDRLEEVGAWDPHNVTEDADLGIRLARKGYRCAMLDSHTAEEACAGFAVWLRQRTRWLKGWMLTYGVHMRAPRQLWRDLGARGFVAFNVLIAGTVLSALAHPIFAAVIFYQLLTGIIFADPVSAAGWGFAVVNTFNLTVGYAAAILLGWIGVRKRGLSDLSRALKWMPVYWLLISLAAYRALWHFVRQPFFWEKTEHSVSRFRLPRRARLR